MIQRKGTGGLDGYQFKQTRPEIESDVNLVLANVSSLKQVLEKAG